MAIIVGIVKNIVLEDTEPNNVYAVQCFQQQNPNVQIIAYPYDMTIRRIPLIGEAVVLLQAQSATSNANQRQQNTTYYYLNPVSLQKNPHNNALPTSKDLVLNLPSAGNYEQAAAGVPGSSGGSEKSLGKGFSERDDVGSLQPFIGDVLLEGRFGHSLRFGYTPNGSKTTQTPSWSSGTDNDPIVILSNEQ